jgi:hypothetical protein
MLEGRRMGGLFVSRQYERVAFSQALAPLGIRALNFFRAFGSGVLTRLFEMNGLYPTVLPTLSHVSCPNEECSNTENQPTHETSKKSDHNPLLACSPSHDSTDIAIR